MAPSISVQTAALLGKINPTTIKRVNSGFYELILWMLLQRRLYIKAIIVKSWLYSARDIVAPWGAHVCV